MPRKWQCQVSLKWQRGQGKGVWKNREGSMQNQGRKAGETEKGIWMSSEGIPEGQGRQSEESGNKIWTTRVASLETRERESEVPRNRTLRVREESVEQKDSLQCQQCQSGRAGKDVQRAGEGSLETRVEELSGKGVLITKECSERSLECQGKDVWRPA